MADGESTDDDSSAQTDPEASVSRRQLLRRGATVAVGGVLASVVGTTYLSTEDVGRITYAMARPEPEAGPLEPRTKEVPVTWHRSLQLAFEAQQRVREAGLSTLVGSFVVPGGYGDPQASLAVDATDERVLETLEDLVEGVALDVSLVDSASSRERNGFALSDAYQISDLAADRVTGGVLCEGNDTYGTLAPALFDADDGSRYFATSNHVYGAAGTKQTEHRGESLVLYHDNRAHQIGEVARGFPTADLVQVAPAGDYRPVSTIERASPSRVVGQYTKMGLADLMARDEPLTKVGALSDRTTGTIEGIDGLTCYTGRACKPGQVKWGDEETLEDGDSGSVSFHEDPENPDDYVLVASVNNARTWWPGADFTWGPGAHHLLDAYGLHF